MEYSVLLSVYEKEEPEYLRESIESMMTQTVPPADFVVVCDGVLGEDLDHVLETYKLRYPSVFQIVRLPDNVGLGEALNKGLAYCRNEWVARMDSDDVALPDRMEKQLNYIEENQVDILSGAVEEFEWKPGDGRRIKAVPTVHEDIIAYSKRRNPFNHPCVIFRKSLVLKAGSYLPWYHLEDYYLWVRMIQLGARCGNLPDTILYMRAGAGLYKRRGGYRQAESCIKLHWKMYATAKCSLWDFLVVSLGVMVVSVIPEGMRKRLYEIFLRRPAGDKAIR